MALIIKDRVKEVTTTTGTGTITLAGASTGFRSFADIGDANTTYYCISGGSQFEVGLGTYTASGTTLSRDTVLSNSLGTTALINFSAGTKDVFCTYPSEKALLGDTSAVSSTGTGSVVLSDSPTFTTAITSTGALQLTGSATVNQNIATNQTTGSLTIGGSTATGTSNITQSTATHTVNIANGTLTTLRVRTINIGVAGASNSLTNTTIGTTGVQGSVRSVTLFNGTVRQQTFTVSGLPTGVAGARSFVTDALAPTFGANVAGGGSVGVPVYHDGTSWKVG